MHAACRSLSKLGNAPTLLATSLEPWAREKTAAVNTCAATVRHQLSAVTAARWYRLDLQRPQHLLKAACIAAGAKGQLQRLCSCKCKRLSE